MITIVSGLPRSGTSLMMQMLAAGGMTMMTDGLREADANNPKGYLEFEKVKQLKKDNAWLPEAEGKVVKIVSHLLQSCLPGLQYQVVFMLRDVAEIVASQESMMKRLGKPVPPVPSAEVMAMYRQHLLTIQDWLARQPNFRVLYVLHRDLLKNSGPAVAKVNAFLGGQLDVAQMLTCVDPSLHRERAD
jgi:hypothetical protein